MRFAPTLLLATVVCPTLARCPRALFFCSLLLATALAAETGKTSTAAMMQKLEASAATIAKQREVMENIYGPAKAEATLLEAFKQAGVKDPKDSPAHNWAGSLWSTWNHYSAFYAKHQEHLRNALADARNDVLKPAAFQELEAGMQKWLAREKELSAAYADYVRNWAKAVVFMGRRQAEWDKQWNRLKGTVGDLTAAVAQEVAPMDKENEQIKAEEAQILNRIVEINQTPVFTYQINEEYGH